MTRIEKPDTAWAKELTPEQFRIARQKGTERAFTGQYWDTHTPGTYKCVCCGEPLFASDAKFDSGSGWPSFYAAMNPDAIETEQDKSHFMRRTEIHCAKCGCHLGHLFEDGPKPTGLRYCVNSASLKLDEKSANGE
jgi:peptide-methionine (R)-S-oxide reductase